MDKTHFEHLLPISVDVEKGETYIWCGCDKSKTQPFCDNSHQSCESQALTFTAELSERLNFCICKQTQTPPLCDGSHAKLLLEALKNKERK